MSRQEDYVVILLRKILALTAPDYFDATDDTYREALLEKIEETDIFLYDVVKDFILSFDNESVSTEDSNNSEDAKEISDFYEIDFNNKLSILRKECKSLHINIDYELEQLINNGNTIEK